MFTRVVSTCRTVTGSERGLWRLENRNDFTVFDKDGSVFWPGVINQVSKTGVIPQTAIRRGQIVKLRSWKQQVVDGESVHWIQRGVDPKEWGKLFRGKRCCLIRREVESV